jgi:hypothetical protein
MAALTVQYAVYGALADGNENNSQAADVSAALLRLPGRADDRFLSHQVLRPTPTNVEGLKAKHPGRVASGVFRLCDDDVGRDQPSDSSHSSSEPSLMPSNRKVDR